jgi:hypothetical protein
MLFYQLPVNFNITYAIFHLGNLVSTTLVTILMVIYQVSNRNRLLRSTCILCFAVSLALFINFCRGDAHIYGGPDCQLQALVLNYFYVSLHAHFCFFMVNSCFAALNWSFLGTKSPEMRTTVFIVASWMIPMFPTIFAIWRFLTDRKPIVLARHFYCAITSPSWPIFRFWFFAFSAPGLFFSFYLLYCTWRYRRMTFKLSKTTQIDKSELFRLFLAIFLYIVLISLSLSRSGNSEHAKPQYNVPDSKNPFKTPEFCISCDRKDYFCSRLCPAMKSYLPVLVGCILFAMYGFGAVASKCYRRLGYFLMERRSTIQGQGQAGDSRRSSHTTTSQNMDKRRLSSTSTANDSTYSHIQRQSLPFSIFSDSSGSNSGSFSQVLHPNLSVIQDSMEAEVSSDNVVFRSSQSNHSQNHQRHHPSLPSIDEDLEVLYMNVNLRPIFKRNFHRRFSEPSILGQIPPSFSQASTLNYAKNGSEHETQTDEIDGNNESIKEEQNEDLLIESEEIVGADCSNNKDNMTI